MAPPSIYVISITTADARRSFMQEQFDALNIPFEFFDAVYGAETPNHPLFSKYDDQERLRRRGPGSSLSPAALGCYASHYLLWQRCVQLDQPVIVLEDDTVLEPAFTTFYHHAKDFASAYGLVWMQPGRRETHRDIPLGNFQGFEVKKFARGPGGTAGYLISPAVAQRMLDYSTTWIYPVDTSMKRFFEHGVEAIGIDPVCVRHSGNLGTYITATGPRVQRTLWQRLRREWFTLSDRRQRWRHNVTFRLTKRRKERFLPVDDFPVADQSST